MNIFIVYCHPCKNSFTNDVKNEFVRGLAKAGHHYEISDLYEMGFDSEFTEKEYLRESYYNESIPLSEEVIKEQEKIQAANAIVFIYPVFWSEAPTKLVGWFDKIWTCGFAYGSAPRMKQLEKALCIAIAGKTMEALQAAGEAAAMQTIMLGDRIRNRARTKEMIFLDGTSRGDMDLRNKNIEKHLKTAYMSGLDF